MKTQGQGPSTFHSNPKTENVKSMIIAETSENVISDLNNSIADRARVLFSRIGMEQVWNSYGTAMEQVWNSYGICMEQVWNRYGIGMEQVWNRYGTGME